MLFSAQSHEFLCSVRETEGGSGPEEGKTEDSDVQLREPFEPNASPLTTVRTKGEFLRKYVRKYILYRLKNTSLLTSVVSFSRARPTFCLRETLCLFRA